VREEGGAAAVVALVDHPRVAPATVAALIAAWQGSDATLVRPVHDGRHGHPYLVDSALFQALGSAPQSEGARPILRAARPSIDVEVADAAILEDVDTPREAIALGAAIPEDPDA
jgi:CTP:molybdopterin cytidylyltransferase MocA